jgi:hypothetical protein
VAKSLVRGRRESAFAGSRFVPSGLMIGRRRTLLYLGSMFSQGRIVIFFDRLLRCRRLYLPIFVFINQVYNVSVRMNLRAR